MLPEARDRFLRQALLIAQALNVQYPAQEPETTISQKQTGSNGEVPKKSDVVREVRAQQGNGCLPEENGRVEQPNGLPHPHRVPRGSLHGRRQTSISDLIAKARALGFGIEGGGNHPLCLVAPDGSRWPLPGNMSKTPKRKTLATLYGFLESRS